MEQVQVHLRTCARLQMCFKSHSITIAFQSKAIVIPKFSVISTDYDEILFTIHSLWVSRMTLGTSYSRKWGWTAGRAPVNAHRTASYSLAASGRTPLFCQAAHSVLLRRPERGRQCEAGVAVVVAVKGCGAIGAVITVVVLSSGVVQGEFCLVHGV